MLEAVMKDMFGQLLEVGDLVFTYRNVYEVKGFTFTHTKPKFSKGTVDVKIFPLTPNAQIKHVLPEFCYKIPRKQYTLAKLSFSDDQCSATDAIGRTIDVGDSVLYSGRCYSVRSTSVVSLSRDKRILVVDANSAESDVVRACHVLKIDDKFAKAL